MASIHAGNGRTKDYRTLQEFDVIVTSYSILLKDQAVFSKSNFRV